MARKITKKEVEKFDAKTPVGDSIDGPLFRNLTELSTEIPLEITNSQKIAITEDSIKSPDVRLQKAVTLENNLSLSENLFIEVHKSNLLQYFSAGCIFPSKYSSQKAFADPQSINENGLLISNGYISDDKEHILIKIDALALDNSLLSTNNIFGLYSGIIPVSRIIKLYVHDNETKKKTIDDSLIRDAGFIPESLIEVGYPLNLEKISFNDLSIIPQSLETEINTFDKILGLIAGSRNFNLLTYNQTGKLKTISDHSFLAIQAIDENFALEIVKSDHLSDYYKWLFLRSCPGDRPLLQWIFNRVYEYSNFTNTDTNEFETLCTKTNSFPGEEKQIKDIFSTIRKSIERKKALISILTLKSKNSLALYIFAYLRIYGTNQNPELPRVELTNSQINKFSEYAFATLNFFFGYKQLRNSEDRLSISDDILKKSIKIPAKPPIKFELTTEFDYRIINSVFNLVFGNKEDDLLKYNNLLVEQGSNSIIIDGYDCYSNTIFGKLYYRILKEDIEELLKNLPNEITIFSEFGLVCHRLSLKRTLIGLDELIGNPKSILKFVHYSKSDLIDAIKANKIDAEEIKYRISLSKKHNEM